jgi:5'-nucleotidase
MLTCAVEQETRTSPRARAAVVRLAAFGLLALAACGGSRSTSAAEPFRVLVTNDDGVRAPGISTLVERLAANRNLELAVFAPATNQSGSGDNTTATPITVAPATTAAGFAATSVAGYPGDCVLFALTSGLPQRPDVVVSGVNLGQNIAEFVNLSGTVGAALWAARRGIPALAVSQGLPAPDYGDAAAYAALLVERLRTDAAFRRTLQPPAGSTRATVLNVNFPTCATGARRGIRVVPLGRSSEIGGYTLESSDGTAQTYRPQIETIGVFSSNCTSMLADPTTDAEAMANGFASVTPLAANLTAVPLDRFRFLASLAVPPQ